MKIVIKVALVLAIIACGFSLYIGTKLSTDKKSLIDTKNFLTGALNTTSNSLVTTEKALEATNAVLVAAQDTLAKTNAVLEATIVQLGESKRETEAAKAESATAKTELSEVKTELASSKESLQKINDAIKGMGIKEVSEIENMTKKIISQTEDLNFLGDQLEKMKVASAALEAKLSESSITPVNLRGQIVGVRNDWGFCVLNLGKNDRVQTNTQFLVYRDTKFVGKIQVTDVSATTSIANVLPEFTRSPLRDGDLVVH
jgi:chromosome segregation ATPase